MTVLLPVLILVVYFYIRKVWFQLRKIKTLASIERLDLGLIHPNLVLPEIKVYYKYYFQGGVYFGRGYLLLADFLDEREYNAFMDENQMVVLDFEGEYIVTSEHIENYLLRLYPSVFVYIDPIEPYKSRLDSLNKTSEISVPHYD
ncbi:MAG: hypothetical protein O9346_14780 [Leptospiraceae bacterium]|jgi:hypothetical protein|nr:hypothetical protein [Leptospiraceae bacterium]MCZ8347679.1 hypothetical protein [Leptospiraceae bacterium]